MEKSTEAMIFDYCKETIDNFDIRLRIALDTIDRMRCPLSMADSRLCNEIEEAIEEYCEENDWDADCISAEDVIWS